jgi:hypothetical protein
MHKIVIRCPRPIASIILLRVTVKCCFLLQKKLSLFSRHKGDRECLFITFTIGKKLKKEKEKLENVRSASLRRIS